ncbi:hypothetical protein GGTG_14124 [Gaeumannomyces tritici R3-111a-1]|uniref:Uncharacterized protein n=1 Tax=Gaeumannomyces tritici (strain R3-111a-1) TaxID=644352 RepID=J3PKQ9_GAET3|nr:hypothetical protein GGTG_14124 [Gaeumannomyces tritici R3-111a-1]EJT68297.1 hypothetical protein GGTG_14124 [Gaeumannomyces tritici R3-111a-1]
MKWSQQRLVHRLRLLLRANLQSAPHQQTCTRNRRAGAAQPKSREAPIGRRGQCNQTLKRGSFGKQLLSNGLGSRQAWLLDRKRHCRPAQARKGDRLHGIPPTHTRTHAHHVAQMPLEVGSRSRQAAPHQTHSIKRTAPNDRWDHAFHSSIRTNTQGESLTATVRCRRLSPEPGCVDAVQSCSSLRRGCSVCTPMSAGGSDNADDMGDTTPAN